MFGSGQLWVVRVSPLAYASISFRSFRYLLTPYGRYLRHLRKASPSPTEGISLTWFPYRLQKYHILVPRFRFGRVSLR